MMAEHDRQRTKIQTQDYLAAPQVGDQILVKDEDNSSFPYFIMKVVHVDDKKIDFVFSHNSFSRLKDVKKLAERSSKSDFDTEKFSFPKAEKQFIDVQEILR